VACRGGAEWNRVASDLHQPTIFVSTMHSSSSTGADPTSDHRNITRSTSSVARFVLRCTHADAHARGVVVQRSYYMVLVVLGRVARPWTERTGWQRKIVILEASMELAAASVMERQRCRGWRRRTVGGRAGVADVALCPVGMRVIGGSAPRQENTHVPKSPEPPPPLKRGGATIVSMQIASRTSCDSSSITTRYHPSPSFLPSLVCQSLSFRVCCQY
jgi:hypothetical protein